MANNQTLPNMNLDSKVSMIQSPGATQVVAPKWEEQKYKMLSQFTNGVIGVSDAYRNLKHTEMMAKMDNVAQQELFKLQNANDPCEIPNIVNESHKTFDEMYKDDPYGKSFYKSDLYNKFRIKYDSNVMAENLKLQKKFDVIQATRTGNELSSDIALMGDPTRMSNALNTYVSQIKTLNLDPLEEEKLITQVVKDSFGKVFSNDPNNAVNWYNASQGMFDKYGIDGADIKDKADKYNRALEQEKRARENHEYTMQQRETTAELNYLKSQIIQNPRLTDSILNHVMTTNNELYVKLTEFVDGRKSKKGARSELSKEFAQAFAEGKHKEFIENHPEIVNDPNAMSVYENIKKLEKTESDIVERMQQAFSEGTYEDFREKNLSEILATSSARETDTAYRKELKISSNADSYRLRIANSNDIDEIEKISNEAFIDETLTDKDKTLVAKDRNARLKHLNQLSEKTENKENKIKKEEKKEKSAKAYGEILSQETKGSEAIKKKALELKDDLSSEDKNKVISLYNKVLKEEGKKEDKLFKDEQEENANKLKAKFYKGELTQEDIDEARFYEEITPKHKGELEKLLYESSVKQAQKDEKNKEEESLQAIYKADANGETVDVSSLPSSSSKVQKAANEVNLKNAKRRYYTAKNEVFAEMLANPTPSEEQVANWKNKLIENNFMGNSEVIDKWLNDNLQKISSIDIDTINKAKNRIDALFGTPLNGYKYTEYEIGKKNDAYKEAITQILDKKTPDFEKIVKDNKPTEAGWQEYSQTRENAYYGQLGVMNDIFEKQTTTVDKKGVKTQSSTFLVKKGVSANQYIEYAKTVKSNNEKGYYTEAQYKELYKPIVINEGYIFNTLSESNVKTIEAAVARQLKEEKGNQIGNANDFAKDFWKCMAHIESLKKERDDTYWFSSGVSEEVSKWYKSTKSQAPNTISE